MDGWACPNVAVQPGLECARRCGCSAECCWRLMGGGGHIVSAPTKQEGASRASVHGVDWVEAGHRAQHRYSNGVQKHPWGPVWRCACVGGMVGGLVVAGASWGWGKNVVNLTKSSQCPC